MTWKEWKEAIERLGVKDEDVVEYIDTYGDDMKVKTDENGRKAIWS